MITTLTKEYIYQYVYLLTGNLARTKGEQYACTPDNQAVLDRYFDSAVNEVETRLIHQANSTYETSLELNADDVTLSLSDHNGHLKESTIGAIRTSLRLSIAYMLSSMWLMGTDTDLSQVFNGSSSSYITDLLLLLSQRSSWVQESDYQDASSDSRQLAGDSSSFQDYNTNTDSRQLAGDSSSSQDYNTNTDSEPVGPSTDSMYTGSSVRDNILEKPVVPYNELRDEDGRPIIAQPNEIN